MSTGLLFLSLAVPLFVNYFSSHVITDFQNGFLAATGITNKTKQPFQHGVSVVPVSIGGAGAEALGE